MNQRQFGRQSETSLMEGQLTLFDSFNEVEITADTRIKEPKISEVIIASYRRKKTTGKRDADLEGLPARIIEHRLSEEDLKENFPTMRWIQLDDGYHTHARDARGISVPYEGPAGVHQEKFPLGLRHLTDGIREVGLRPAIWIGLKVPRDEKLFIDKEADDWFLK